ncbi:unnamed protein product [Ambrosiozyma monospora]|uniref:Unnamed protein product n=1 Tax=Ambrosiozyma monospora TaxID=43982 RepID=A0ACB5T6T5_AMBMO|nr:unnamed protein product [Ambrosiozyma monospora]
MNFIRSQRSDPQYNPNTTHCIYGLDADLIFLGLATHEPHFRILREDVFAKDEIKRQLTTGAALRMDEETRNRLIQQSEKTPFLWLHVNVLREYLEVELDIPRLPFPSDIERAIDDWIFMCFFVGNDFLPHLPSLNVRNEGVDLMVANWKKVIPTLKNYITCDGIVDLEGAEKLLAKLAGQEDDIFKKMHEDQLKFEAREKRKQNNRAEHRVQRKIARETLSKGKDNAPLMPTQNMTLTNLKTGEIAGGLQYTNSEIVQNINTISQANTANKSVAEILKQNMAKQAAEGSGTPAEDASEPIDVSEQPKENPKKRSWSTFADDIEDEDDSFGNKSINLWQPGYHDRYYQKKFNTTDPEEVKRIQRDMVKSYMQGVQWVLLYYYQGCPSWNWYFPYHYAPFAADFVNLTEFKIEFDLGSPFRPFEQLMSVLPADSSHNLPEVFRSLMSDPDSEIIDFYPEDFKIDMNGARAEWQGLSILPFIDEKRLLKAVRAKYPLLTDYEKDRNTNKGEMLLTGRSNKHFSTFVSLYKKDEKDKDNETKELNFHCHKTGLAGKVSATEKYDPVGYREFKLDIRTDETKSYTLLIVRLSIEEEDLQKEVTKIMSERLTIPCTH